MDLIMKLRVLRLLRAVIPKGLHFSSFCPRFLRARILERTQLHVASGPFQGMHYIEESFASVLEPKLLGIYEHELHQAIEAAVSMEPTRVIDIGAAEGYYAIGLARRLPQATVYAFEADKLARTLLKRVAEINNVASRVHIFGLCQPENLEELINVGEEILLICDVEGAEATLLDPEVISGLQVAHILVELHSKKSPGIQELLTKRFRTSHTICRIEQQPRSVLDYPYREFPVNLFPKVYIENAVSEFRQPWEDWMTWLWMVPNNGQR